MNKLDFSKIGFDYGIKPYFALINDPKFSELFKKADCIAVQYVFDESQAQTPIQLGFVFKNENPAEEFINILLKWIQDSNNDGDAVAIDFIEENSGGYSIGISPEIERFHNRMIPSHLKDRVTPLFMTCIHFKKMKSKGCNYLNFKNHQKAPQKISVGYAIGNISGEVIDIKKYSKKYFPKTKFNFYHEDKIENELLAESYNVCHGISDFAPKDLPKQPNESKEEISKRRISEMKRLLPLTYNRLDNLWLDSLQKKLNVEYNLDIIKQGICNLTMFERIKQDTNVSSDFTKRGYPVNISDYLNSSFESFDSFYPQDDFYTEDIMRTQIENDKVELENHLNK